MDNRQRPIRGVVLRDPNEAYQQAARCNSRIILAGWTHKVPKWLWSRVPTYNVHMSLLPLYRGCSPVNWQIIDGYPHFGATLHRVTGDYDKGDLIWQERVTLIEPRIDQAFNEVLTLIRLAAPHWTFDRKNEKALYLGGFYRGRRTPEMGEITDDMTVLQIDRMVRALAPPWPCARYKGQKIIWGSMELPPAGTNLILNAKDGTYFATTAP